MSYSFFIQNERTKAAFNAGYPVLNFVGAGITNARKKYKGDLISYLDIYCPTRPVIFYRGAEKNGITAPHSVVHKGGNNYRVFAIGQAEIFVFSTKIIPSGDKFGMEIYGGNGKLVFDHATMPIKPVSKITFAGMEKGEGKLWQSNTSHKLAYALCGSAIEVDVNMGSSNWVAYRSVVQSVPGGFALLFVAVDGGGYNEQWRLIDSNWKTWNGVSSDSPIQMLVIDVNHLRYQNMQDFTIY